MQIARITRLLERRLDPRIATDASDKNNFDATAKLGISRNQGNPEGMVSLLKLSPLSDDPALHESREATGAPCHL